MIEIKHKITDAVLRVIDGANLYGANLYGAKLMGGVFLPAADTSQSRRLLSTGKLKTTKKL